MLNIPFLGWIVAIGIGLILLLVGAKVIPFAVNELIFIGIGALVLLIIMGKIPLRSPNMIMIIVLLTLAVFFVLSRV